VEIPGHGPITLAPVCLPYSPEFAPDQPGRGAPTLVQLAAATGGKERIELPQIWADLVAKPRWIDLSPWLFVMAALLFLVEIFERRTGWFGRIRKSASAAGAKAEPVPAEGRPAVKSPRAPAAPTAELKKPSAARHPAPVPADDAGASAVDALRKARERAGRRTKRD